MYKLMRAYADGSIEYVGVRNTVSQVRAKWSESKDAEQIATLWRSIYDKGRNQAD